ncbi:MAG: 16S rRNA (cytosine(1402)-N(4))-methyltransferase RsmH [Deltaproteobacteria bacterium]|nr:16S rRNA (cytosine(1402)-N(4))-methyltransferase RsmH [Deltaproteobacteria bacterium]
MTAALSTAAPALPPVTPGFVHAPVMLEATLRLLDPQPGGRFLDGTLGGGGHSAALLEAVGPTGLVVSLDRDPHALAAAGQRLAPFGAASLRLRGRFSDMVALAGAHGPFDGVLLDIGTSSPQLDHAARGFSFQHDGPLDMRMDPDGGESAAELIDRLDEEALADIIFRYGEEPRSRRIARALVAGRPWSRTAALAEAVAKASGWQGSRTHPATKTFQALRIAVNDELGELERALPAAISLLRPGGRLALISFHSLEDRIVKGFFRDGAAIGTARDAYGQPLSPPTLRLLTRRPLDGAEEDPSNPRARSARLRVAERLPSA